jgi:hypothetical protein
VRACALAGALLCSGFVGIGAAHAGDPLGIGQAGAEVQSALAEVDAVSPEAGAAARATTNQATSAAQTAAAAAAPAAAATGDHASGQAAAASQPIAPMSADNSGSPPAPPTSVVSQALQLAERLAGDAPAPHANVRGAARATKHHAATRHTTKASLRTRATVQTRIVGSSVRSSSEAIASSRSTLTTSSFARARPPAAHAKREAPAGALPQQLPPVPLPERQDTTSSGQAGGGSGALLPLLLAALASALAIFGFQLLPRLLPRPAFRKPRRFSLPPWHPG